jgi:hypothetical protein
MATRLAGMGDALLVDMTSARAVLVLLGMSLGACRADAQPEAPAASVDGPVRCHRQATSEAGLDTLEAKLLCIGAGSAAPALCVDGAREVIGMSKLQAVLMCRGATTTEPVRCAQRLQDETTLANDAIADYCAAERWPYVASPEPGSPDCVEAALDRTALASLDATRLCRGSMSTAPVDCFLRGKEETALSNLDLVDLCAPVVVPYAIPSVPAEPTETE